MLLQVEALEKVERAFVHVDYIQREMPEHKVERSLLVDALKRRGHRSDDSIALSNTSRQHIVTAV